MKKAFDEINAEFTSHFDVEVQPPSRYKKGIHDEMVLNMLTSIICDHPELIKRDITVFTSKKVDKSRAGAVSNQIMDDLGFNFTPSNKSKLMFYIPYGICHWWNKYVGLPLARKLMPDRTWVLREGLKHTTVWCPDTNEVFDMVYWSMDGRLEDHEVSVLLNRKIKYASTDLSLGGQSAFVDSDPGELQQKLAQKLKNDLHEMILDHIKTKKEATKLRS